MPRPEKRNKWADDFLHFSNSFGDLGVIIIALIFSAAFVLILFSHWRMPSLTALTAQKPTLQKVMPKPETEMTLFSISAEKNEKKQ